MKQKKASLLYKLLFGPFPAPVSATLCFLIPVAAFYLLECLTHNPFTDINIQLQLYSWLFYIILYAIFLCLMGRMRWAYPLVTVLLAVIGVANYYTLSFRSSPILPWDLRSFGVAMSVAGNQTYEVTVSMKWIFAGFAALILLSLHCGIRLPRGRKRLAALAGSAVLAVSMMFGVQTSLLTNVLDIYEMPFTQWFTYRQNGFMVSFFMNAKYLRVAKPAGYSAASLEEELAEAMAQLSPVKAGEDGEDDDSVPGSAASRKPNLIVIMDEAFSDLSVLGEFQTNEDYLPFFRSLTNNTISGTLYVSVLGGNTANTEFEFLTGDTMAFLPSGSIPYQQYCQSELPSLASQASAQGYHTVAMHPYYATGWNRSGVYQYLGFDDMYFLDDFKSAARLRQYVSDQAMFQKIISLYQEKGDEPLFLFGVTMQNHSSYSKTYDNFTSDIHVLDGEYPWADTYLSLIRQTDQAYQNLINYFTYVDEPTIILFFGDHQPTSLERKFFNAVMDTDTTNLSLAETALRYQTPFKLWANFDIEEQSDIQISANYLGTLLFETAGLELTEYQQFLAEIRDTLPIVTANFYYDAGGSLHSYEEDSLPGSQEDAPAASSSESRGSALSTPPGKDLLDLYARLQYNHLFDTENRIDAIFRVTGQ